MSTRILPGGKWRQPGRITNLWASTSCYPLQSHRIEGILECNTCTRLQNSVGPVDVGIFAGISEILGKRSSQKSLKILTVQIHSWGGNRPLICAVIAHGKWDRGMGLRSGELFLGRERGRILNWTVGDMLDGIYGLTGKSWIEYVL
jgi:hypothetical protein